MDLITYFIFNNCQFQFLLVLLKIPVHVRDRMPDKEECVDHAHWYFFVNIYAAIWIAFT